MRKISSLEKVFCPMCKYKFLVSKKPNERIIEVKNWEINFIMPVYQFLDSIILTLVFVMTKKNRIKI